METLIHNLRCLAGELMLRGALRVIPVTESTGTGVARGLTEQRDYDRYEAYCIMLGDAALPFYSWREQRATMVLRTESAKRSPRPFAVRKAVNQ